MIKRLILLFLISFHINIYCVTSNSLQSIAEHYQIEPEYIITYGVVLMLFFLLLERIDRIQNTVETLQE